MPVPNIDFNNMSVNMLPLEQRRPFWIMFAQALISPIVRLYGIFLAYMNGETLIAYSPIGTYGIGAKVRYNYKTYESIIAGNNGNAPDISPLAWTLRNNSFIGATERAKYNGRYLELTYALNRYFNTTFRQPPYPAPYDYGLGGGVFSDIYISNVEPAFTSFVVGATEGDSSIVYIANSNGYVFATQVYGTGTTFTFAINFPIAVYNSLGVTNSIRNSVVAGFVNQYLTYGTNYIIVTY